MNSKNAMALSELLSAGKNTHLGWTFVKFGLPGDQTRCMLCHAPLKRAYVTLKNERSGLFLTVGEDCFRKVMCFTQTGVLASVTTAQNYKKDLRKKYSNILSKSFLKWIEGQNITDDMKLILRFIGEFHYPPTNEAAETLIQYSKRNRQFLSSELFSEEERVCFNKYGIDIPLMLTVHEKECFEERLCAARTYFEKIFAPLMRDERFGQHISKFFGTTIFSLLREEFVRDPSLRERIKKLDNLSSDEELGLQNALKIKRIFLLVDILTTEKIALLQSSGLITDGLWSLEEIFQVLSNLGQGEKRAALFERYVEERLREKPNFKDFLKDMTSWETNLEAGSLIIRKFGEEIAIQIPNCKTLFSQLRISRNLLSQNQCFQGMSCEGIAKEEVWRMSEDLARELVKTNYRPMNEQELRQNFEENFMRRWCPEGKFIGINNAALKISYELLDVRDCRHVFADLFSENDVYYVLVIAITEGDNQIILYPFGFSEELVRRVHGSRQTGMENWMKNVDRRNRKNRLISDAKGRGRYLKEMRTVLQEFEILSAKANGGKNVFFYFKNVGIMQNRKFFTTFS